jgi:hypothetical protein
VVFLQFGEGPGIAAESRVEFSEQAGDTLAVPAPSSELEQQLAASIRLVEQRKQAQAAPAAAPAWANFLVAQSNALIDAYAAVVKHSARHEGLIKAEDVRSIFLSAFINVAKGGNRNAA